MLYLPQPCWHNEAFFCTVKYIVFIWKFSHQRDKEKLKIALTKFFNEQKSNWRIYSSSMKTWQCKTVELPMGYLINRKLGYINYFLNNSSAFVGFDVSCHAAQNYSELLA